MKAWGEIGAPGDSVGGGAGVSRRARMREKKFLWGLGKVMRLDVTTDAWLSQASRGRETPEPREPLTTDRLFVEGRAEGGYKSKRSCNSSTMSCRVAISPGFLSE